MIVPSEVWDTAAPVMFTKTEASAIRIVKQGRRVTQPELEGLVRSVNRHGVLAPILVFREPAGFVLVAGERRLKAFLLSDRPSVPVRVTESTLTPRECDRVRISENVDRKDLSDTELAIELVSARCELLVERYVEQNIPTPSGSIDDPVGWWELLMQVKETVPAAAVVHAPWQDVLDRLGLSFTVGQTKKLVQALQLPPEWSKKLDENTVPLTGRIALVQLTKTDTVAASNLVEFLDTEGRWDVAYTAAAGVAKGLTPEEAVSAADGRQTAGMEARAASLGAQQVTVTIPAPQINVNNGGPDQRFVPQGNGGFPRSLTDSTELQIRNVVAAIRDGSFPAKADVQRLKGAAFDLIAALKNL